MEATYYIDQNSLANSALASSWRHLLAGTRGIRLPVEPLVPQTER
jgi:hypothetical protein